MTNINSRTPLKTIKAAAMNDFGIIINNDDAKDIREGARCATLMWDSSRFINTSQSANVQRMTETGLMTREGGWSRKEWNARKR